MFFGYDIAGSLYSPMVFGFIGGILGNIGPKSEKEQA